MGSYYSARHVLWTSTQTAANKPAYPTLRISIVQLAKTLTGSLRDDASGIDVLVSSGSIDEAGNVRMTVALSDRGELRQILIFDGRVDRSTELQQIVGTYVGLNPPERGRFLMTHD